MYDDASWDDSDVRPFDWDQSEQTLPPTPLAVSWDPVADAIDSDHEPLVCGVCHSVIRNAALHERNIHFCSEYCWESAMKAAVNDFSMGVMGPWPLDAFISFESKVFLLTSACDSHNGKVVVQILRYFQAVLKPELFERLLLGNDIAFSHFANFLRKTRQWALLQSLLTANGRIEHSMVLSYCQLTEKLDNVNVDNVTDFANRLQSFSSSLSIDPRLKLLFESVTQLSELLRFQYKYESRWKTFCLSLQPSDADSRSYSGASSLLALPLSETVQACCLMDKDFGPEGLAYELKTNYKILDDQFRWLLVEPLVLGANWAELDNVILEKKWLKRRTETNLPNDRLIIYLHALKAPTEILERYLSYSNDTDEIIQIATRMKLYRIALKLCIKRRDPAAMKDLLQLIPKTEPEYTEMVYYLSIPVNQWKDKKESKS